MCYEQMMEDMRYEENAHYDRWDGHRGDMLGVDCDGWPDEATRLDYEEFCEHQDREGWEASFSDADNADHAACLADVGVAGPPRGWESV